MNALPRRNGFTIRYTRKVEVENGAAITYIYYPHAMNGSPILSIEFSLPNLIFGNNVEMVSDIGMAISQANNLLPVVVGVPKIDLWDGVLYRLDICYNHQVVTLVPYYVKAMQSLEYSRRRTLPYSFEGVMFKNRQKVTKFYNKEKERMHEKDFEGAQAAQGILRQETGVRKKAIKKLVGKKEPTLRVSTSTF